MKRLYLPLILFLLLVMEGVALEILPTKLFVGELAIIPHWVLIFLMLIGIFYDRENTYFCVLYAILFGLLIDIVYTGILGVYMFTYAVAIYIIHGLTRFFHSNLLGTILFAVIGIIITDISINIIYSVVGITELPWNEYIRFRLLPTILANLMFLIVLYPITKNKLINWKEEQLMQGTSL